MKPDHSNSRRKFLKTLGIAGVGTGALLPLSGKEVSLPSKGSSRGKVKNFILMVSDGMNCGTFTAANHWLNISENRDSEWMQLYKDGLATRHLCETSCADSIVTDSAAASSAWGIGQRVNMGAVNWTPEAKTPTPIGMLAKQAGKSVGMVSTARIPHATPAGFVANMEKRNMEDQIAAQYLERKIDVLLGGGDRFFNPEKRKDGLDLYTKYQTAGYHVVKDQVELAKVGNGNQPLLGVFSNDHMPYWVERMHQAEFKNVPSLEQMTEVALQRLSRNSKGFFLQIEAARVDHAAHGNDPATVVTEQLEFDRTIGVVRKFAELSGDTLVVITSDHGTGGFMLCGADDGYEKAGPRFTEMMRSVGSLEQVKREVKDWKDFNSVYRALEHNYAIQLSEFEREAIHAGLMKPNELGLYGGLENFSEALNPIFFQRYSVSWNCFNHTADLVELGAMGPGAEAIPGFLENWQLNGIVREMTGV